MTDAPPSRYRVVERGRRLVVIDRLTGEEASHAPGPAGAGVEEAPRGRLSLPSAPVRTRFDGGAELTTHALYDEKAPRTIQLDAGSAATIGRVKLVMLAAVLAAVIAAVAVPVLLVLPLLLLRKDVRRPIRSAVTRWLDRVEREAE